MASHTTGHENTLVEPEATAGQEGQSANRNEETNDAESVQPNNQTTDPNDESVAQEHESGSESDSQSDEPPTPPSQHPPAQQRTTNTDTAPRVIRVPGTFPPEWLPDSETDSCMACGCQFTLIKRRHHCRSCGKIFCSDCCKLKARLLFLDNKQARVCNHCHQLIEFTLSNPSAVGTSSNLEHLQPSSSSGQNRTGGGVGGSLNNRVVHGVLKTSSNHHHQTTTNDDSCNVSNSSSSDQHSNKQVTFSDGVRPGSDPCETGPASPSSSSSFSIRKGKSGRPKNITVCDELGYLPPIVISKEAPIASEDSSFSTSNPLTNLIVSQFRSSKKTLQASMESRSCPLNGIVKFEELSSLVGVNSVITFVLLKGFYLRVKIITKDCCMDRNRRESMTSTHNDGNENMQSLSNEIQELEDAPKYWCFTSSGLDKLGQDEIIFVLDKDKDNSCIPRDIFKIYLTLHELAVRRQPIENLGNLLFQDGLFGSRDTAGLLFVRPFATHCLNNLVFPARRNFLIALVLQRWEVPWSKVFPMRLLLRLGHKYETYPYPIVSFRTRDPVYYEVGHTIISILGDFRNYRYSLTHVDGLRVMLDKSARKVTVHLHQASYVQFSKVLDSSNNEHVLAWSSSPFSQADGHLVSVQNDVGQYETVEFYKKQQQQAQQSTASNNVSFRNLLDTQTPTVAPGPILGASFIVFSGALKLNQSGQPAKISIVEDGLLIQIQSCTMSALRNAINYMDNFDIDCENSQDSLNRVEIRWELKEPT